MQKIFEPVYISGAGCITAAGHDLPSNLANMEKGTRQPQPYKPMAELHDTAYPVFSIPDSWLLPLAEADLNQERCSELAWIATREALQSASLRQSELDSRKVGICLGTVAGAALDNIQFHQDYRAGKLPSPKPVISFIKNNPAQTIQAALKLDGPCMTITTACTSGSLAIAEAGRWIRQGICDVVIAGGTEKLNRITYSGFISLMITDSVPCRPFDRRRQGLNLGEGAGIIIIESADSVRRRQATPWACLAGDGNFCDAYHLSRPKPNGQGLRRAIGEAMRLAGVTDRELAFINAHGTATPDNDRVEGQVFRDLLPNVPFCSSKAYTGHTLGAAGGIEAVLTLAGLIRQHIPATAGFSDIDPEIGVAPTRQPRSVSGSAALSTSVAYGGNNSALIIKLT